MPDYEYTGSVDAEPDDLFDYLADVQHLPEYLPRVTDAKAMGADEVIVEEESASGGVDRASAWVHVDELERRMEWGTQGGPYHGWLQVDPGDVGGSLVTIHLHEDHEGAIEEEDLTEAVDNIRRLVAAGAA